MIVRQRIGGGNPDGKNQRIIDHGTVSIIAMGLVVEVRFFKGPGQRLPPEREDFLRADILSDIVPGRMLQSADNSVRADHHDLFVITKGHLAIIVREIIGAERSIGHAGKGAIGMVEAAADRNRPARRGVIVGWLPDK